MASRHSTPHASDPPRPAAPAAASTCANCGEPLLGAYCHRCGQAGRSPIRSVRAFVREVASDLADLDSRAVRSFGFLVSRPGYLTRAYLAGRRVRYTQPLQLYVVAAAVFFFVNAYKPFVEFHAETGRITSSLNAAALTNEMAPSQLADLTSGMSVAVFEERFDTAVTGYLPTFLIGSVLLFALLLRLLYRRSGRAYLEHAVFALHWTGFYLLLMVVDRLLPGETLGPLPVGAILVIASLAYLAFALRTVYERPWPGTLARAGGLYLAFQALLVIWMLSAVQVALAIVQRRT
jgi:hypothetical protein